MPSSMSSRAATSVSTEPHVARCYEVMWGTLYFDHPLLVKIVLSGGPKIRHVLSVAMIKADSVLNVVLGAASLAEGLGFVAVREWTTSNPSSPQCK